MEISRLGFAASPLVAAFAASAVDWSFRRQATPQLARVGIECTLTQEMLLVLPAPMLFLSAQSKEDTLVGEAKINLSTTGVDGPMTLSDAREKWTEDIIAYR